MTNLPTVEKTDEEVMSTLIASHGDVELAAERLGLRHLDLLTRLPKLPLATLVEGLKIRRLLKTYDAFTLALETTIAELGELPVQARSKFLVDLMDRLEVMLNPPVHGGSGQSANVQINVGDMEEARARLASRIIPNIIVNKTVGDPPIPEPGGDLHSPLRLGTPSEAESTRTFDSLVDMVAANGTRLRQDTDGGANDASQGGA